MEQAAPDAIMEQAIREVDDAVEEVRKNLSAVISERHLALKRLAEENKRFEDLEEKISLALKEQRDDLAEAAVSRQLDIEAQLPIIQSRIEGLSGNQNELEGYILALQGKRREMEEELRELQATRRSAENASKGNESSIADPAVQGQVERASGAFERAKRNLPGGDMGSIKSSPDDAKKIAELDNLSRKNRVQERLHKLKADALKE